MNAPQPPAGAGTGGGAEEGEGESALAGSVSDPAAGHWPSWRAKIFNDFRSSRTAKANDGLVAPAFPEPDWANADGPGTEVALEATRRRHDAAEARIANAEGRAGRLIQFALSLLAIAFVSTGFQATRVRSAHAPGWVWLVVLLLAGGAIVCLAMSAIQAIGVDRVGFVQPANPALAASLDAEKEQRANLTVQEYRAFEMANWTARHKTNEMLQARAWLTRGLSLLIASGVCAIGVWTFVHPSSANDCVRTRHERSHTACKAPGPH